MKNLAIRVENIGKEYRIGTNNDGIRPRLLGETITNICKTPFRFTKEIFKNDKVKRDININHFWALKDISFEVKEGEILGIIGHNGAGKSTLLKILSRITTPTIGRAEVYGRIGSLLEVGTGFHSELTGRENIYLNGAILGMKKSEIKSKFEEIVAFAEVEDFLDTPVKHYSSGMFIRLAFAVAAHLEPEILVVDEVLAVGDAAFQQKCLGKMEEIGKSGRTVLYVSHNLLAMEGLCDRLICLKKGQIESQGHPREIISDYLRNSITPDAERIWNDITTAPGNKEVRLHRVFIQPANNKEAGTLTVRSPFTIEFEYWNLQTDDELYLNIEVYNEQGILLFDVGRTGKPIWQKGNLPKGLFRDKCFIPGDLLNDGIHRVDLTIIRNEEIIFSMPQLLYFEVQDSLDMRNSWFGKWSGAIRPALRWNTEIIKHENNIKP